MHWTHLRENVRKNIEASKQKGVWNEKKNNK